MTQLAQLRIYEQFKQILYYNETATGNAWPANINATNYDTSATYTASHWTGSGAGQLNRSDVRA